MIRFSFFLMEILAPTWNINGSEEEAGEQAAKEGLSSVGVGMQA